jgi:hypothetical protein
MALVSFFFGGNFYCKVVSVSTSLLWAYAVFIFPWKTKAPSSLKPVTNSWARIITLPVGLARISGFMVLLAWCAMLTPLQLFVPTPMDAWTKYSEHPPFKSSEVIYPPHGTYTHNNTVVEYVSHSPCLLLCCKLTSSAFSRYTDLGQIPQTHGDTLATERKSTGCVTYCPGRKDLRR